LLCLAHQISSRLFLERIIRLADVRAIHAVWPPDPAQAGDFPGEPEFKTGPEVRALAIAFAEKSAGEPAPTWLVRATVYVPESAPVILRVEAGLAAAESADYYPPLISSGPHIRPRCDQIGCDL
jgi:hypothetical protein